MNLSLSLILTTENHGPNSASFRALGHLHLWNIGNVNHADGCDILTSGPQTHV